MSDEERTVKNREVLTIGRKSFDIRTPGGMEAAVKYAFAHVFRFPGQQPSNLSIFLVFGSLALGLIVGGGVVSYHLNDWTWFARSGSLCILVVTVMILF
jgi:hypothetical protein